jgi:hypothetical protein
VENHFWVNVGKECWWRQLERGKKCFLWHIVNAFCIVEMLFLKNVIKNEESSNNAP